MRKGGKILEKVHYGRWAGHYQHALSDSVPMVEGIGDALDSGILTEGFALRYN